MKDNNNYKSIQVIALEEGVKILMVNLYNNREEVMILMSELMIYLSQGLMLCYI
jgi:hypothetical protein